MKYAHTSLRWEWLNLKKKLFIIVSRDICTLYEQFHTHQRNFIHTNAASSYITSRWIKVCSIGYIGWQWQRPSTCFLLRCLWAAGQTATSFFSPACHIWGKLTMGSPWRTPTNTLNSSLSTSAKAHCSTWHTATKDPLQTSLLTSRKEWICCVFLYTRSRIYRKMQQEKTCLIRQSDLASM